VKRSSPLTWLLLVLSFVACRAGPDVPPPASPSSVPRATVATATVAATQAPPFTATATTTPSATPWPAAIVAAPPAWEDALAAALAETEGWQWQPLLTDDPAGVLAAGDAHLALVPGQQGVAAGQRPFVLAVPFTANWEETTSGQAQEIVAQGHELVTVTTWDELTPQQKPLYVDGFHPAAPAYPLQQPWSLLSAAAYEAAAAALAPRLRAQAAGPLLRLTAVGDIMLDRALGAAIGSGNLDFPFASVQPLLKDAGVTVGNLESALGDVGKPAAKRYTFRAPPAAAESLARAGFDVLSLANNHALDYGPAALLQGLDLLRAQGIATVGAGQDAAAAHRPALYRVNGLTLAFLGYVHVPVEGHLPYFDTKTWTATADTPSLAWADPAQIANDVAAARQEADHVVVLLHSGYEYGAAPSPPQVAAAHAAVDAGAALVVGHHAHILQGVEFYNGGVIVYGLGNFAFTITGPPETALLNAWLDEDGVRQIEFIPAVVQASGQPRPADAGEATAIRQQIYALTTVLNPR
jgi:poly-gamma-glutamate synthesis protein (capsule biosynthesis protein)